MIRVAFLPPPEGLSRLIAHLIGGWSCFEHRGLFWLSRQSGSTRAMILAPRWIIAKGITLGLLRQTGIRVTTSLPLESEGQDA